METVINSYHIPNQTAPDVLSFTLQFETDTARIQLYLAARRVVFRPRVLIFAMLPLGKYS